MANPGKPVYLKLRDLILFGIIAIQPVAPMSSFGVLYENGHGHVVTALLIAAGEFLGADGLFVQAARQVLGAACF